MRRIENLKEVKSVLGQTLREVDLNEHGQVVEERILTLPQLIKNFIIQLKIEDMVASEKARDCINTLLEAEKNGTTTIDFSDTEYKWLMKMVVRQAPGIYAANAIVLKEALEDVVANEDENVHNKNQKKGKGKGG